MKDTLYNYLIQLADSSMILGQRLSAWCGHGPILEVDMALTNIALDLIGQARNYYQYAAQVEGKGRTEDDLAMLRDAREYRNVLLVEQANGDFGQTIVRQFFFDAFHLEFLGKLAESKDPQLAAMAQKSIKEVRYHYRYSSEWLKRLGDGTAESHQRTQNAVDGLWMYLPELFLQSETDKKATRLGIGVDLATIEAPAMSAIRAVLAEATLEIPNGDWGQSGGKKGIHSEHLGHILAEMQWMQRAYPNMKW